MNFREFATWTKENNIELKLKSIGGCMADTIIFEVDGNEIYTEDYCVDTNYDEIKDNLIKIISKY